MELSHYGRFSQSWALKNLPNLYWANVEVAAKHSVMEVFFVVIILPYWFGWGILCLEKTQETPKHLISTYRAPKRQSQHIKFFSQEKILRN